MGNKYIEYLKRQYNHLEGKGVDADYILQGDSIDESGIVNSHNLSLNPKNEHAFHTKLLPQPVVGDLSNGKIFICILNPGFHDDDYKYEPKIRNEILKQYKQDDASLIWLKKEFEETPGGKWWRSKFNQRNKKKSLVENIVNGYIGSKIFDKENYDENIETVFSMISRIVVDLELIPYHSKNKPSMKGLESVKKMKEYVHKVLIPKAENNKQIICFARSIKNWEVTEEEKKRSFVICNEKNNRGNRYFSLSTESPIGEAIFKHFKTLSNNFSKLL